MKLFNIVITHSSKYAIIFQFSLTLFQQKQAKSINKPVKRVIINVDYIN